MVDVEQIKQISIVDMLSRSGIEPQVARGGKAMYLSPLREDSHPSFAVDMVRNLWYDFGSGEGGSVIDLCMKLNRLSYTEAVKMLANDSQTVRLEHVAHGGREAAPVPPRIRIDKVRPAGRNPVINAYLQERGIPPYIAALTPNLCEVYYNVGEKRYFGVGFKNDAGGYELRNKYFKGCGGHKAVTTIDNGSDSVTVVEGFMDFVSLVAHRQESVRTDVVVLNSTAMFDKALPFLAKHGTVFAMLDNDSAGDEATAKLKTALGGKVIDKRGDYAQYKDINEYLVAQNKLKYNRKIK